MKFKARHKETGKVVEFGLGNFEARIFAEWSTTARAELVLFEENEFALPLGCEHIYDWLQDYHLTYIHQGKEYDYETGELIDE